MATESISMKHVLFTETTRGPSRKFRGGRRIWSRTSRFRFGVVCSKTSDFQDFRSYEKPLRLLPAEEVKICRENPAFDLGGSEFLYKVKLWTSKIFGAGLSYVNARVLLCLIDDKGDSILQTIPASLSVERSLDLEDIKNGESLRFQRGSVDEFVFGGPELGRIQALWIGLDSGQWRLRGVSLCVLRSRRPSNGETNAETLKAFGYQYDFEVDDTLLGDGSELSMVELRPINVTELSSSNALNNLSPSPSTLDLNPPIISNEQSMKEYAGLKFSLLLYDAILVLLGTSASFLSLGQGSGAAFFIGGLTGFLYLLLLQRSVDGLQVPESQSGNPKGQKFDQRIKISISGLALGVGLCVLALRSIISGGEDVLEFALTPREILVGTLGFLVCKVAVVLAAFKPLPESFTGEE